LVLQSQVETLKSETERTQREVAESRTRPKKIAKTASPTTASAKHPEESLLPIAPGTSELPTVRLGNHDLLRMEETTAAKKEVKPISSGAEDPTASEAYNNAYRPFEEEKYTEAALALEAFAKKYPTHSYADNALFWAGESYFRNREFGKAVERFERVGREFPTGNKVPDALLRAGSCYLRLAKPTEAKRAFERVLGMYPQSIAAHKAKTLMADMSVQTTEGRM
jgi:tol-pal system protein YbgF